VTAAYDPKNLGENAAAVEVSGWNVKTKETRP
jgi:hypothetical protein